MSEMNDREWRERLAPVAPPTGRPDWQALEARILERARAWLAARRQGTPWDVLAAWARPGLTVAAAWVLLIVAAIAASETAGSPTLEDALQPPNAAPSASALLASSEPSEDAVARFLFDATR
jgi:hypothetical protein